RLYPFQARITSADHKTINQAHRGLFAHRRSSSSDGDSFANIPRTRESTVALSASNIEQPSASSSRSLHAAP
ncbi:hypothetical protein, partial [Dyella flava]|uniref:hypothetical protein n=1 Tax=Dyella flava TaxID=1920170 RepID=UPI001955F73F